MNTWLSKELNEHSALWIIISAFVGGFIGAFLKMMFENLIPSGIEAKQGVNEHFRGYSHKLLLAARNIDNRLDFIIKDRKNVFRYDNENAKLSLYYAFAYYFTWCKIVQDNALNEFHKQPRKYRSFFILFYDTHKALSSNYHLSGMATTEESYSKSAVIPFYCIQAISEQMLASIDDNKTIIKSPVISFNQFCILYNTNSVFREWFTCLEKFIENIKFDKNNLAWNRLVVFSLSMKTIIRYIDRGNHSTKPVNNLPHFQLLNEKVLEKVRSDFNNYEKNWIKDVHKVFDQNTNNAEASKWRRFSKAIIRFGKDFVYT